MNSWYVDQISSPVVAFQRVTFLDPIVANVPPRGLNAIALTEPLRFFKLTLNLETFGEKAARLLHLVGSGVQNGKA